MAFQAKACSMQGGFQAKHAVRENWSLVNFPDLQLQLRYCAYISHDMALYQCNLGDHQNKLCTKSKQPARSHDNNNQYEENSLNLKKECFFFILCYKHTWQPHDQRAPSIDVDSLTYVTGKRCSPEDTWETHTCPGAACPPGRSLPWASDSGSGGAVPLGQIVLSELKTLAIPSKHLSWNTQRDCLRLPEKRDLKCEKNKTKL